MNALPEGWVYCLESDCPPLPLKLTIDRSVSIGRVNTTINYEMTKAL
jgi:hypothetical protein